MIDKTINDIYYCKLSGLDFAFYDSILYGIVDIVSVEIDNYDFDSIDFERRRCGYRHRQKYWNGFNLSC